MSSALMERALTLAGSMEQAADDWSVHDPAVLREEMRTQAAFLRRLAAELDEEPLGRGTYPDLVAVITERSRRAWARLKPACTDPAIDAIIATALPVVARVAAGVVSEMVAAEAAA